MSIALRQPMTLDEFLAWEGRQEFRYEFDGWQPVAMTGGTVAHETIGGTLRALLRDKLQGKGCRVFGPTLKVEVAGRIRYPDAFVYCTPVPRDTTVIRDPVAVFEVISRGSSRIDRIEKLREYQATPSIQHYVILEQESIGANLFSRTAEGWDARPLLASDTLNLPAIGVTLALNDIYADVDVPETLPDTDA